MMLIISLIVCVVFIVLATTRLHLHPFLALLIAAFSFGLLTAMPLPLIITSINEGFGGTIGNIGIIIIFGIIIGTFLENSGGAYALASSLLRRVGRKRLHLTLGIIGFTVSIPVFADSGFIILSPLNKALSRQAGVSLAGTALALSLGLMSSHTLVPPTPGPIAAAGILQADLGLVILLGLSVSVVSMLVCVMFATYMGKKVWVDPAPGKHETATTHDHTYTPGALKSFLPIIVPISLIVLKSVADYPARPLGEGNLQVVASFVGQPVVALFAGMLLALTLPRRLDKKMLSEAGWVGAALKNAAIIILITGAGGAFGKILQNSALPQVLSSHVANWPIGLWLPFLVAAALKSAQGSSTVAIITTASLMAPLLLPMQLHTPLLSAMVVVAIGAGSNVASHANDSFFWVMTQMTGISVKNGYRLLSTGTVLLGVTAMLVLSLIHLIIGP
jgi:GntP family gluconate:H+ symporter